MKKKKATLCLAIASMSLGVAHAEGSGEQASPFTFSGFGTLGVAHSSYDKADFTTDRATPNGAGRTEGWSITPMTRVGVQVDTKLSEQWSATVQALSEYTYKGNYQPEISSAYIKYQATPAIAFRVGRLPQPTYMLTDYQKVGYAMPWAKPPLELYYQFVNYEGADVLTKFQAGGVAFSTQAFVGNSRYKIAESSFNFDNCWGINVVGDVGASTFRIGHLETQATMSSKSLQQMFAGYRAAGDIYAAFGMSSLASSYYALANDYDPVKRTATYDALGYAYDPGNWFLRAEIAKVAWKQKSIMPNMTLSYISAGVRIGSVTPYVLYGREKTESPTSIGDADLGLMGFQALNVALANVDNSRHSVSAGLRWDFRENMDFKLQYSHVVRDTHTSLAGLINIAAGTAIPSSYDVIFAGIDFVF